MSEHSTNEDIARTSAAFMAAMREARDLTAAGAFGPELNEILIHARELLDIIDEHMLELDKAQYADAFALVGKMRSSLDALTTMVAEQERADHDANLH
jgi:hypothetical protein